MSARRLCLVGTMIGAALLALPAVIKPAPLLLWNASPSAPLGLYALQPSRALRVGDLVAVRPPAPLARWLALRRYLPLRVPLLKHIAALKRLCKCRQ